jgi:peptidoglycan/LPS O-acetylase OafA/YrhL
LDEYTWIVLIVIAICSYLSVKAWVNARRAERDAFYRSETLKKFAEMQGTISEPVMQVLREAIRQKEEPPSGINYDYNREREAFYRSETAKKIAELGGGPAAALEYLREDEKKSARRHMHAIRLGGMITAASGIALMVFLAAVVKGGEVYLAGLIPASVGIVLVIYSITSASRD